MTRNAWLSGRSGVGDPALQEAQRKVKGHSTLEPDLSTFPFTPGHVCGACPCCRGTHDFTHFVSSRSRSADVTPPRWKVRAHSSCT